MLVTRGWLWTLTTLTIAPALASAQTTPTVRLHQTAGAINVWDNGERPYKRGDAARVYFRTEKPGHVTILRADTDGRIRVLFPSEPWQQNFVRGGRVLEIAQARKLPSFTVDEDPGIGYILAVTSPAPFKYQEVTRGDYWDFRVVRDGRIRGDPYVALTDLAQRIAPASYQYDITPYYVDRHYDYPRFACYDCHTYASYGAWDPYTTSCLRYRVVIYDDPAYYPYRYSQGRNVVTSRPLRPAPRFVFKEAAPDVRYVTRLRQRESHQERRASPDDGRTSADVGGPGMIPAPGMEAGEPKAFRKRPAEEPVLRRGIVEPAPEPPVSGDPAVNGQKSGRESVPSERLPSAGRDRQKVPPVQRGARSPQSTGEPELRRRKP